MDFDFSRQNVDCNDGTVQQGDDLPLGVAGGCVDSRLPPLSGSLSPLPQLAIENVAGFADRNSLSRTVNPASTERCRINMSLAAEGAALAAGMQRATCSGCHGSGRKDYGFGERSCDYCNGSGLHIDECRQELVDAIGDKLADTNDLDVGWTQFARAVVALLEERGADVTVLARP